MTDVGGQTHEQWIQDALRRYRAGGGATLADRARADLQMMGSSELAKKRNAAVEMLVQRGMPREQAMDQVQSVRLPKHEFQTEDPTAMQSFVTGAGQGATAGFEDELTAAIASAVGPESYETYRDVTRERNQSRREAHPWVYGGGELVGGVAASGAVAAGGGARMATQLAAKGVPKAATGIAAATGGGATAGLGYSEADLTQGEFAEAGKDTFVGAGLGAAGGIAGVGLNKGIAAANKRLRELGRGRLFKAAVGQNKRAFRQINGKKLYEDSVEYLESMGVRGGLSTEGIGEALTKRLKAVNKARDAIVRGLDAEVPPQIDPMDVAERVEKTIGAKMKGSAANRQRYAQVQKAIDDILELGDNIDFAEAARQRSGYQNLANYDRIERVPASEEINRAIAKAWNDVIDEKAEPILRRMGKGAKAYKEIREEQALLLELNKHVTDRIQGNQSNRWPSPSDYGAGGVAFLATQGDPFYGLAAATANHLARVYGNGAAGRTAVGLAKLASQSPRIAQRLMQSGSRSARAQEMGQAALEQIQKVQPVLQWPPKEEE